MNQAKCTDLFAIHPKCPNMVVSRRKYDPGKKCLKQKASTEGPSPSGKEKKRDSQRKQGTTSTPEGTIVPMPENSDSDDDSLPDPFGEAAQKEENPEDDISSKAYFTKPLPENFTIENIIITYLFCVKPLQPSIFM